MISQIIYTTLLAITIIFEVLRQSKSIKIDGLLFININFGFIYGYVGLSHVVMADRADPNSTLAALFCVLGYVSARTGYRTGTQLTRAVPRGDHETEKLNARIYRAAVIAFLFGVVCVFLYARNYGGFTNSIRFASAIRSGYGDQYLEGSGSTLFFKNLIPIIQFLPVVCLLKYLKNRSIGDLFLFLSTGAFTVFGLFLMAGRGRVVIFFLLLLLCSYLFTGRKRKMGFMTGLLVLGSFLLVDFYVNYGKEIFQLYYSPGNQISDIFAGKPYVPFGAIAAYFDHRIYSVHAALGNTLHDLTLFYDAIAMPLYLIPSRITGISPPDSISYLNTSLILGVWESTVPPGVVAYGIYSLNAAGVFIASFIYGVIPGAIDKKSRRTPWTGNATVVLFMSLSFIWHLYYFQGDPRVFIKSMTPLLLLLLIFKFTTASGVSKKRRRSV